jgi:hypothetical protein
VSKFESNYPRFVPYRVFQDITREWVGKKREQERAKVYLLFGLFLRSWKSV